MKIEIRNIFFNIDQSSYTDFWNNLRTGKWEPNTFDVIDRYVSNDNIAIDLGCWIGPLSLYMAKKGATVYAIDPDPHAYKWFIKNLNLNPELKSKIHPRNVAISQKSGEQILYARKGYGYSSTSLLNRTRDKVNGTKAKTYSLDEFIKINSITKIDFLKIDIEGGEFAIINQLKKLKSKKKYNTLFLSLHYDHLNEAVYQKKITSKKLSLILMKIERIMGFYFFRNKLQMHLKEVCVLTEEFNFIYSHTGKKLTSKEITPGYLLNKKIDLLMSDSEWNKNLN
ncbi:MAG: FkbM family methyltransferase [Tenacibaculum sp.]|nr:FkbM family methyltransferase [Tenacibaculum sp.]